MNSHNTLSTYFFLYPLKTRSTSLSTFDGNAIGKIMICTNEQTVTITDHKFRNSLERFWNLQNIVSDSKDMGSDCIGLDKRQALYLVNYHNRKITEFSSLQIINFAFENSLFIVSC
jgi:hypothetical protein